MQILRLMRRMVVSQDKIFSNTQRCQGATRAARKSVVTRPRFLFQMIWLWKRRSFVLPTSPEFIGVHRRSSAEKTPVTHIPARHIPAALIHILGANKGVPLPLGPSALFVPPARWPFFRGRRPTTLINVGSITRCATGIVCQSHVTGRGQLCRSGLTTSTG